MTGTSWTVITRPKFVLWFDSQDLLTQKRVAASLKLLKQRGPMLGRPYADTVYESAFPNMKELRIQNQGKPVRAFFAFDPLRQAIVLCAGDKSGDKRFYDRMIPLADSEYQEYLKEEFEDEQK